MLDDPISLFIPVGAIGRVVGKAGEKLALESRAAYAALMGAKTLKEGAAARRRLLALFRERMRSAGKLTPDEEAARQKLLQELRDNLDQIRVKKAAREERVDELAKDPDKGYKITDELQDRGRGRARTRGGGGDPQGPARGPQREPARGRRGFRRRQRPKVRPQDRDVEAGNVRSQGVPRQGRVHDIRNGEKIILNRQDLSDADLQALLDEIDARGLRDQFMFHPDL